MSLDFLIGADPELFVRHIDTGKFISGHDLIPGTKLQPHFVDGGAIQVDGTALEFNIIPAENKRDFRENIFKVMDNLYARLEDFAFADHYIAIEPVATFDKEYFDALPDEAKLLGCEPDFNAYTGKTNTPPNGEVLFRTAGGHIHIGWGNHFDPTDPDHFEQCRGFVKQLDALLYPASLIWDKDEQRRELYGAKGAFRPKVYGVEYRPLSNAWLRDENIIDFVYDTTVRAADLYFNKGINLYDAA